MKRITRIIIGGSALAAVAGLGTGVASAGGAGGEDGSQRPIIGAALTRAEAAALQSTNGGRVTDTEVGDEESLYEVEVTKPDGSQIDVQLDGDFTVVASMADKETVKDGG